MRFVTITFLAIWMFWVFPVSAIFAQTLNIPTSSRFGGKSVTLIGEFKDAGKQKPLVVLLHGCGGLDRVVRNSLRSHASALKSAGFSALILDSFTPRGIGGGWVCDSNSRLSNARKYRKKDVRDAVEFLASKSLIDPDNIFVVGQSNGGSVSAQLARRPFKGLRAAVAYYPWCGAVSARPSIPLLVLAGVQDNWTPPERCSRIDRPGGTLSVITYPNAVHSFDLNIAVQSYKGYRVGGNPQARSDSRKRMVSFFKSRIK